MSSPECPCGIDRGRCEYHKEVAAINPPPSAGAHTYLRREIAPPPSTYPRGSYPAIAQAVFAACSTVNYLEVNPDAGRRTCCVKIGASSPAMHAIALDAVLKASPPGAYFYIEWI